MGCGDDTWCLVCLMADSLHVVCSVCSGMDVKWTAVLVYIGGAETRNNREGERAGPANAHSPTGWQR